MLRQHWLQATSATHSHGFGMVAALREGFMRWIVSLVAMVSMGAAPATMPAINPAKPEVAEQLQTLPGLDVEVVMRADGKLHGSWISLGKDNKGRLILGAQRGQPITRVTIQDGLVVAQEQVKLPVSEVMGV